MKEFKLKQLFDLQMGKTPKRKESKYWKNGVNDWISISDLSNSRKYINQTSEKITDIAVREFGIKVIPKNTVVMSFKLSIGKVAITEHDMYSNEAVMAFHDRGIETILPEYLYYLLSSKDWNEGANKAVKGITLNKTTLSNIKIKIHKASEQAEIIKILSNIEGQISYKKDLLIKYDYLIKSRFVEMFGVITQKENGFTLGDVCLNMVRGPFGSSLKKEFFVPEGPKTYKVYEQKHAINKNADIGDYYISNQKFDELRRFEVKPGDIIMSCSGTIGALFVIPENAKPGLINQALLKFELDESLINHEYFIQSMELIISTIESKGSGIANITSVNNIKKTNIFLPTMDEQNKFTEFVKHIDKLKFAVQKSLDETQMLFDSLLQEYFG